MHTEEETKSNQPGGNLTPGETDLYSAVIRLLKERGIPFVMAGGYTFSHYSGCWRSTKDLDVVTTGEHFLPAVETLRSLGLRDYYEVETYDRGWIYRAYKDVAEGRLIVDIIHKFPNRVGQVDDGWLRRGVPGSFAGERILHVAPEDMVWMKLFVFQRHRNDWTDLLCIIRGLEGRLDWSYLLERMGENWLLLAALIDIYDWLCPSERAFIPQWVRDEMAARRARPEPGRGSRATVLDSRQWLTAPGAGLANLERDAGATAREETAEAILDEEEDEALTGLASA